MSGRRTLVPIVLLVLIVVVAVAVPVLIVRRLLARAMSEVESTHPEHVRVMTAPMANFFGISSRGMRQARGNGVLILTESELYFRMLAPSREVRVPLRWVSRVSTPKSFLGKSRGVRLLEVGFRKEEGGEDAAAWQVPDVDRWVSELTSRCDSGR